MKAALPKAIVGHSPSGNRRYRLQFSLASLLLIVLLSAVVGREWMIVQQRHELRNWAVQHKGAIHTVQEFSGNDYVKDFELAGPADVPLLRRMLGDEPLVMLALPYGTDSEELRRARNLFPEANVYVFSTAPGSGFF